MYAFLRTGPRPILVTVNLAGTPETDYDLGADSSSLRGEYACRDMIPASGRTAAQGETLSAGRTGGFAHFKPANQLRPHQTCVWALLNEAP